VLAADYSIKGVLGKSFTLVSILASVIPLAKLGNIVPQTSISSLLGGLGPSDTRT